MKFTYSLIWDRPRGRDKNILELKNCIYKKILGGASPLEFATTASVSSALASIFSNDEDRSCGISKNAQRKIMGGLDAGYGQFPW